MSSDHFLENEDDNRRSILAVLWSRALMTGLLVGLLVAIVFPWYVAVGVGALIVAVVILIIPKSVIPGLATVFEAGPATELEYPRLINLVEGLSASTGVAEPELRVLRDSGANMAAYGPPENGVLVFTSGLLDSVDRISLEAIVAEGLARLKCRDAELGGVAAVMIVGSLVQNGPHRDGRPIALASFGAKWKAGRLAKLRGPQHEFRGDMAAVRWTRYPPGLERALISMAETGTVVQSATWGTSHLWLANPLDHESSDDRVRKLNSIFDMHDSLDHRAALMAEL